MAVIEEDITALLRVIGDPKKAAERFEQLKGLIAQSNAAEQRVEDIERALGAKNEDIMRRDRAVREAERELAAAQTAFVAEKAKADKQLSERIASLEKAEKGLAGQVKAAKQREHEAARKLEELQAREADLRALLDQAAQSNAAAERARQEVEARLEKIRALGEAVAA
jgi:chromosome segregation ATPase